MSEIESAIIQEDFPQAKKLSQDYLSAHADEPLAIEARYYLALSQVRLGEYKEARDIFNDIVNSNVNDTLRDKAYIGLFDSYFMEERYENAFNVGDTMLKLSPHSEFLSLIYLKMARVHLKLTHWDEAKNYLEKIIGDFPGSLETFAARQLLDEKQYFAVQVGSFIDRVRAEGLVNELKGKGEYAYIVEVADKDSNQYYRVRVGQLAKLEEAQSLRSHLSEKGYPTQIYP